MNIQFLNGGHFISRGLGKHPERVIDSRELIVVNSGTLGIFEKDRRFEVKEGEFLLLHPGRKHGGTLDYRKGLSFFWLHFLAEEPEELEGFPQYGTLVNRDKTVEFCRLLLNNQEESGAPPENGALLMRLILNECARERAAEKSLPHVAGQARVLIGRRCTESAFTAGALAAELGCHRDYLNRVFREAFGETVSGAINRARMNYCRNLLLNTTMNIKEICFSSGYNDEAYFRRRFLRQFNTTPHRYRKQHAREHTNS
jgi:AraC-like DNA-binding protein